SSSNTNEQVKLKFETKDQAVAYAQENNIQFDLINPKKDKLIIKSYADNFLNNV
ncbi:MAG: NADH dehydrogenase ubiquinone Fe-S protein 4, partial [Candidatus Fonsibacter sp.]